MDLKNYIEIVEDWPKPGIKFKDITPLMANGAAYKDATDKIVEFAKEKEIDIMLDRKLADSSSDARLPMQWGLALLLFGRKGSFRGKQSRYNMVWSMEKMS